MQKAAFLIAYTTDLKGNTEILLIERSEREKEYGFGSLGLAGGECENDETTKKAALREFKEELGVNLNEFLENPPDPFVKILDGEVDKYEDQPGWHPSENHVCALKLSYENFVEVTKQITRPLEDRIRGEMRKGSADKEGEIGKAVIVSDGQLRRYLDDPERPSVRRVYEIKALENLLKHLEHP